MIGHCWSAFVWGGVLVELHVTLQIACLNDDSCIYDCSWWRMVFALQRTGDTVAPAQDTPGGGMDDFAHMGLITDLLD
jgi:hypothetical protein